MIASRRAQRHLLSHLLHETCSTRAFCTAPGVRAASVGALGTIVTPIVAALAVASGGALGALLRWGVSSVAARSVATNPTWSGFPLGTVIVNVVGVFALAWLVSAGTARDLGGPGVRLFLGTGLLGALTTFSTFGLDAHGLFTQGRAGQGLLYLGGTLILAGFAVVLGWALGR